MESRDRAYWENLLAQCSSFSEKVEVLEELLSFLREELAGLLGSEENQEPQEEARQQEDVLEFFVEALETLRKREENTISAPPNRKKIFEREDTWDVEGLSLQDLLELYSVYLGKEAPEYVLPDAQFEHLLEERRERILALCTAGDLLPMQQFFADCTTRKMVIATFLVLLDLVFRDILLMQQKESGEIFLGRAKREASSESP